MQVRVLRTVVILLVVVVPLVSAAILTRGSRKLLGGRLFGAAAGPRIWIAAYDGAERAFTIDHGRPHSIGLEQASVGVGKIYDVRELRLKVLKDLTRDSALLVGKSWRQQRGYS